MTVFKTIWDLYNTGLMAGIDNSVMSALSAMAVILQLLGALFVAVFGLLMVTGDMAARTGLSMVCRLLLVQAAMVPAYFNTYVRDVVMVWFPNWLAGIAGGTSTAADGLDTSATQFDTMVTKVFFIGSTLHAKVSWGDFATAAQVTVICIGCLIILALIFLVWVLTRVLLALTVALAPFVFVLHLFASTRGFVEGWVRQLATGAALLVMITILIQISMTQLTDFMKLNEITKDSPLVGALDTFMTILLDFVINVVILYFMPRFAMSIGSAIAFSPGEAGRPIAAAISRAVSVLKKLRK